VLLPLTLLASIFGMNVDFPGSGSAGAFWVMVAAMVAVFAGLIGFFRWKRWI
jgi:magnesium transporter